MTERPQRLRSRALSFVPAIASASSADRGYVRGKATNERRVYVGDEKLVQGGHVALSVEEVSHLRAARVPNGSVLHLLSSNGALARAVLQGAYAEITSIIPIPPRYVHVSVGLGHLQSASRVDWAVEKLVEVGVSTITLLNSSRCVKDATQTRAERLRRVAVAAAKQSLASVVPRVDCAVPLTNVVDCMKEFDTVLLLSAYGTPVVKAALESQLERVLLLIGPEGGFDDVEEESLRKAGARPVSLGLQRLRAETAAVTAAATIMQVGFMRHLEREHAGVVR